MFLLSLSLVTHHCLRLFHIVTCAWPPPPPHAVNVCSAGATVFIITWACSQFISGWHERSKVSANQVVVEFDPSAYESALMLHRLLAAYTYKRTVNYPPTSSHYGLHLQSTTASGTAWRGRLLLCWSPAIVATAGQGGLANSCKMQCV